MLAAIVAFASLPFFFSTKDSRFLKLFIKKLLSSFFKVIPVSGSAPLIDPAAQHIVFKF